MNLPHLPGGLLSGETPPGEPRRRPLIGGEEPVLYGGKAENLLHAAIPLVRRNA
jgi:hypothetical protein